MGRILYRDEVARYLAASRQQLAAPDPQMLSGAALEAWWARSRTDSALEWARNDWHLMHDSTEPFQEPEEQTGLPPRMLYRDQTSAFWAAGRAAAEQERARMQWHLRHDSTEPYPEGE